MGFANIANRAAQAPFEDQRRGRRLIRVRTRERLPLGDEPLFLSLAPGPHTQISLGEVRPVTVRGQAWPCPSLRVMNFVATNSRGPSLTMNRAHKGQGSAPMRKGVFDL